MAWNLTGNANVNDQTQFLGTKDNHALVIKTNGQEVARVDPSGNVGIGTATPTTKLEVVGKLQIDAQDAIEIVGHQPFLTLTDSANNTQTRIQNAGDTTDFFNQGGLGAGIPQMQILDTGTVQINAQDALHLNGYQPFLTLIDSNTNQSNPNARAAIQNAGGDINFFTDESLSNHPAGAFAIPPMKIDNTTSTVQINAQDALHLNGYQPFLTLIDSDTNQTSPNARAVIQNAGGDINFFTQYSLSTHLPGAFPVPPMKINNTTNNVEVNTDLILNGADCAEDFDVACGGQIEPGTVVVIDPEGVLTQSHEEYDKKVAGVVSGAGEYKPGMVLDRRKSAEGRKSIALLGKVYCKVDASRAPIDVGDLLTTSNTPGHAMKATDPFKAFGAVIGKALRPLREGQGLIPMLIALQ